jgi:hypothetical protein
MAFRTAGIASPRNAVRLSGTQRGRKRSRNVLIRLIRVNCNTQVAHNDELHDLYESDVAEEPAEIEIARPAFPSQRATSQS